MPVVWILVHCGGPEHNGALYKTTSYYAYDSDSGSCSQNAELANGPPSLFATSDSHRANLKSINVHGWNGCKKKKKKDIRVKNAMYVKHTPCLFFFKSPWDRQIPMALLSLLSLKQRVSSSLLVCANQSCWDLYGCASLPSYELTWARGLNKWLGKVDSWGSRCVRDSTDLQKDNEIEQYTRNTCSTVNHVCGTVGTGKTGTSSIT